MATSRLFNIEPIGVGTPYVESLPSYIKRLAEAHSVFPGVLLKNEIFPEIRDYHLNIVLYEHCKFLLSVSSEIINDLIRVLEMKTSNNNIHYMSLSKLSGYINPKYLFRDHAAWCPLCYEESRQSNEPVYEQMIWSISDIDICGKHGTPLHVTCPQCHKQIKHYDSFGRAGYCYHCKHWLGLNNVDDISYSKINEWDQWVLDNIGSLLSGIPKFYLFAETCLSKNILEILNLTGLSKRKLAKEISVTKASIQDWAIRNKKPTLHSVLLLGYKFGLPISKLLLKEISGNDINLNSFKKAPTPERHKVDYNELLQSIEKAIASTELISNNKLAIKYGVKRTTIIRHFPAEYNLLKQNYIRLKEENALVREDLIRDAMISLNERGIFPNVSSVASKLGKNVINTKRYRAVWESTLRELGFIDKICTE